MSLLLWMAILAFDCIANMGSGRRVQEQQKLFNVGDPMLGLHLLNGGGQSESGSQLRMPKSLQKLATLLLAFNDLAMRWPSPAGRMRWKACAKQLGFASELPPTRSRCAALAMQQAKAMGWEELQTLIQQSVKEQGLDLHEVGRRGVREATDGPPSAQTEVRLFGADKDKVRVKFYRDNHAWCPYCHKVWMQLEEKQIPYQVEKVSMNCYGTKSLSFLAKTPMGLLPAIEIDGKFDTESSYIMELLEDNFPESKPMTPQGTAEMLQLERSLFGAWLSWLRADPNGGPRFERAMDATERALERSGGPYFLGDVFTLADCVFASSLERIAASILFYKGLKIRGTERWSKVEAWFREMEKRDSYLASRSDYHTHVHDLPPQIGGCLASGTPEQLAAAAEIDGTDGRSWNLPLPPLTADSLEPGSENPVLDRLEAANALVKCHEGILKSSKGGAEAEAAFQIVAQALVEGYEANALKGGEIEKSAAKSLRWTRDRICVPRDMSFAAARQLRAHLNWAADIIDPQPKWVGDELQSWSRKDSDPVAFGGPSGNPMKAFANPFR